MITRISLLLFLNLALCCCFIEATYTRSTTTTSRPSTFKSPSSSSSCKRKCPDINGIIVPAPTPYTNNELDLDKVEEIGKDFAKKGIKTIAVAEKFGEGYLLSLEECKALYKTWVEVSRRHELITIVVVGDPTPTGIELASYAESIGVDAIMCILPLYYKPLNAKAAVSKIKLIADCAKNTPIILYVDPSTKPECVRIDELYYLATEQICNFAGIRCSMEVGRQIYAAGLYKPYQYIIITNHYSITPAIFMGFNASVTVANALAPKMALKIQNAQSLEEALVYQEQINILIRKIAPNPRTYLGASKAAYCIITGIDVGPPRPPIDGTSCEYQVQITKNLQQLRYPIKNPVLSCGGSPDDDDDNENTEDCMEAMKQTTSSWNK